MGDDSPSSDTGSETKDPTDGGEESDSPDTSQSSETGESDAGGWSAESDSADECPESDDEGSDNNQSAESSDSSDDSDSSGESDSAGETESSDYSQSSDNSQSSDEDESSSDADSSNDQTSEDNEASDDSQSSDGGESTGDSDSSGTTESNSDDNANDSSGESASDADNAANLENASQDANSFSSQPPGETVQPCGSDTSGGATPAPAPGANPGPPPVPGNLEVTVTDSKTGEVIEGATVSISGPESQTGKTNAKAVFKGIKTGSYTVKAEANGYTTENGSAGVAPAKTATLTIPVTPITVAITLDKPVGCPGHPLSITAAGTPAGGIYAWEITGASVDLVDGAGSPIRTGAAVNLLGFAADDSTGTIKELNAKIKVTYTFTNGQTATDSKDVKIHEIKFNVADKTINKSDTTVTESATTIKLSFGAAATMSTDPQVEIQLDASCPRKTDCATNHRVGWLQTVWTFQAEHRYTHTRVYKTPAMPVRDALAGVTRPFYSAPTQFTGDKDKETAHHEDSPGMERGRTDGRTGAPAPPPAKNRQLRQLIRSESFTAWLVVQNIEWAVHDMPGSFAFQGNFDWSMGMTVNVDLTQPAGSQATPKNGPPTVPATISAGKGSKTPNTDAAIANDTTNDAAILHIDPAPEI